MIQRYPVAVLLAGLLVAVGGRALAQTASPASGQVYPNKSIRIITAEAGGSNDLVARQIAQGIAGALGQPVIVDNRGGGIISAQAVSKAPPDGYTLLAFSTGLWTTPLLQTTTYDPIRDFAPVTLAVRAPNVLAIHPSLPAKSVKELIALAKARPGELNYGTGPPGSAPHLAAELFKAMAGLDIVRVSYKGVGAALNNMITGEVQLVFGNGASVTPHATSGRLRALAVTSAEPSALLPGLPTLAASVPGYESVTMTTIFAPAATPAPIIGRLNQEMVRFLRTADVRERLLISGVEAVGSTPEQLAATMKTEITRLGKVIKDAGIRN